MRRANLTPRLFDEAQSRQYELDRIKGYLEMKGWRVQVHRAGLYKRMGGGPPVAIGEPGMPRLSARRYVATGVALAIWCDVRAEVPDDQAKWRAAEAMLGGAVKIAADFDDFADWYQERWSWVGDERALGVMRWFSRMFIADPERCARAYGDLAAPGGAE